MQDRSILVSENVAEQDPAVIDEAMREPAHAVVGRLSSARVPTRHRPVHGPSHPHAALLNRCPLSTGRPVSRSDTSTTNPGSLVHVELKKLGSIHDGGG